jgi:hypothetical protein
MLADYFTKPLQGKLFHLFRNVIMGWKHIDTLKQALPSMSKERVGDMGISDDATKSLLTYAQAVNGQKQRAVNIPALLRTKARWFPTTVPRAARSVHFLQRSPEPHACRVERRKKEGLNDEIILFV